MFVCVCVFIYVCVFVYVGVSEYVLETHKNTPLLYSLGLARPHAGPVRLFNRLLKRLL